MTSLQKQNLKDRIENYKHINYQPDNLVCIGMGDYHNNLSIQFDLTYGDLYSHHLPNNLGEIKCGYAGDSVTTFYFIEKDLVDFIVGKKVAEKDIFHTARIDIKFTSWNANYIDFKLKEGSTIKALTNEIYLVPNSSYNSIAKVMNKHCSSWELTQTESLMDDEECLKNTLTAPTVEIEILD